MVEYKALLKILLTYLREMQFKKYMDDEKVTKLVDHVQGLVEKPEDELTAEDINYLQDSLYAKEDLQSKLGVEVCSLMRESVNQLMIQKLFTDRVRRKAGKAVRAKRETYVNLNIQASHIGDDYLSQAKALPLTDKTKYRQLLQKAVEYGNREAANLLVAAANSEKERLYYLSKASDAGDAEAALILAAHYEANDRLSAASRYVMHAVRMGHPELRSFPAVIEKYQHLFGELKDEGTQASLLYLAQNLADVCKDAAFYCFFAFSDTKKPLANFPEVVKYLKVFPQKSQTRAENHLEKYSEALSLSDISMLATIYGKGFGCIPKSVVRFRQILEASTKNNAWPWLILCLVNMPEANQAKFKAILKQLPDYDSKLVKTITDIYKIELDRSLYRRALHYLLNTPAFVSQIASIKGELENSARMSVALASKPKKVAAKKAKLDAVA